MTTLEATLLGTGAATAPVIAFYLVLELLPFNLKLESAE